MSTTGAVPSVKPRAEFKYSFDSKCLELAEHFLPAEATQALKKELAQAIWDAVENFYCGYPSNIKAKP